MKIQNYSQFAVAVVLAMALSACAQLGLATPDTFNQKAAVALGTVTQVRESATALLTAKQISADDADNVLKATDVARTGIDTARKMQTAGDTAAASGKLDAIRTGLTALSAYLASRGK